MKKSEDFKKLVIANISFAILLPFIFGLAFFFSFPLAVLIAPGIEESFQEPFMLFVLVVLALYTFIAYYWKGKKLSLSLLDRVRASVGFFVSILYIPLISHTITAASEHSVQLYSSWLYYIGILILLALAAQYIGQRRIKGR